MLRLDEQPRGEQAVCVIHIGQHYLAETNLRLCNIAHSVGRQSHRNQALDSKGWPDAVGDDADRHDHKSQGRKSTLINGGNNGDER
jgi:hypothetical protein